MKYLLMVLTMIIVSFGCTKEYRTSEEQLLDVIQSKINFTPENATFFLLKNEKLCENLDCSFKNYTLKGFKLMIYSREEIFMRAPNVFFEVKKWKKVPDIVVRNKHGKIISFDSKPGMSKGI